MTSLLKKLVSQDSMAGSTESRRSPVRRNMKKSYGLAALFKFVVDISTKYPCSSACPSLLLDLWRPPIASRLQGADHRGTVHQYGIAAAVGRAPCRVHSWVLLAWNKARIYSKCWDLYLAFVKVMDDVDFDCKMNDS